MDREAFAVYELERAQVERLIRDVERATRALLERIGCPPDPAGVFNILHGDAPEPSWPKKTAARNRQRARHALHVLAHLEAVRRHVAFGHENARQAAHGALLAGLYASAANAHEVITGRATLGGEAEKPTIVRRHARWAARVHQLKADNPRRSAAQIRVRYQEKYGVRSCPSLRTIQDLLKSK